MTQRRIVATQHRIEQTIEVAQRRGLTARSVEMYPDGRVVIHLGVTADGETKQVEQPKKRHQGW